MQPALRHLIQLLVAYGPWLIFLATALETAAFVGLLMPAEAIVILGTVLAQRGILQLDQVALATVTGALVGDQLGYAAGRYGGGRFVARARGRLARAFQRYEARSAALFRRHSIVGITLARFVSFVRTLMPWMAGIARVPYLRYLGFDVLGVLGWAAASLAAGYLAAESWTTVVRWFGPVVALVLLALLLLGGLVLRLYRHRWRRPPRPPGPASGSAGPPAATP